VFAFSQPHPPSTQAVPFALLVQSTQAEADPQVVEDAGLHAPVAPPQQEPGPQTPPSQLALQPPSTHDGVSVPHELQSPPDDPHCA